MKSPFVYHIQCPETNGGDNDTMMVIDNDNSYVVIDKENKNKLIAIIVRMVCPNCDVAIDLNLD